jgi:hypothetical protein
MLQRVEVLRIKRPISADAAATGVSDESTIDRPGLTGWRFSRCIYMGRSRAPAGRARYRDRSALTANPPLSVLVYECKAPDLILVALPNARGAEEVPSTADAIVARVAQIGFNSTLATELQSIRLAKALAQRSWFSLGMTDRRLRGLRLHTIEAPAAIAELEGVTRYKTDPAFISALRKQGRERAEEWLRAPGQREPPAAPACAANTLSMSPLR